MFLYAVFAKNKDLCFSKPFDFRLYWSRRALATQFLNLVLFKTSFFFATNWCFQGSYVFLTEEYLSFSLKFPKINTLFSVYLKKNPSPFPKNQGRIHTGNDNVQMHGRPKKHPKKWRAKEIVVVSKIPELSCVLFKRTSDIAKKKWLEVCKTRKSRKFCWYWGKLTRFPHSKATQWVRFHWFKKHCITK